MVKILFCKENTLDKIWTYISGQLAAQYMNTNVIYSVLSMHEYKNIRIFGQSSRCPESSCFKTFWASDPNERVKNINSIWKFNMYSGTFAPKCADIWASHFQRDILAPCWLIMLVFRHFPGRSHVFKCCEWGKMTLNCVFNCYFFRNIHGGL